MPAIYIDNLVKEYPGATRSNIALDSLNLVINEGQIFGLLGPNGAGKSTLINILAGIVNKTSGVVKINDISIDEFPQKARTQIGIVPQEIALDSFFSLYNALEHYAGYFGIRPAQRKTEELLTQLSLWDKKDVTPKKLSGGMKRRFLIAKAMVHSPKILVLDEPTAGVDLELRNQLWDLILSLKKQGVTIILTTHYLAEAEILCDEIAFINKGKIIKQSSKNQLLIGRRYIDIYLATPLQVKLPKASIYEQINEEVIRFNIENSEDYSKFFDTIKKLNLNIKNIEIIQPNLESIFHTIMNN
ncbi:MAG: ABC transporter ATP-binding protein [Rickettsiaceae bacterium]|nr:ABC transporter ATP-binding protein [Rickettsiaceae bacterium]